MKFNKFMFYGFMLNLLLITHPASAMLRRFAPQTTLKLATATLCVQKRRLLEEQKNHPLWIKVNKEIDNFFKENNITPPTATDIAISEQKILDLRIALYKSKASLAPLQKVADVLQAQYTDSHTHTKLCDIFLDAVQEKISSLEKMELLKKSYALKDFKTFFKIYDEISPHKKTQHKASTAQELALQSEIDELLIKHSINPASLRILFDSNTTENKIASTDGFTLCLPVLYQQQNKSTRKAIIEHEISHIINKDPILLFYYSINAKLNQSQLETYELLIEKRADIHSAIQSFQNAHMFLKTLGYVDKYQDYHAKKQPLAKRILYIFKKNIADNYAQEVLDYHEKSTSEDKQKNFNMAKIAALTSLASAYILYNEHEKINHNIFIIQKILLGVQTLSKIIGKTIEEKTNKKINRIIHTYSIVDCKTK